MFVYTQRVRTPEMMNGGQLVTLGEEFNITIQPIIDGQLYKAWMVLWSLYSKRTWKRLLYIDDKQSEVPLTMYAPAYISFSNDARNPFLDLITVDHDVLNGIRTLMRKKWSAEPIGRPPLTERIPPDMEVESVLKIAKDQGIQTVENYDSPIRMGDVYKEASAIGRELASVTLWSERQINNIKLHSVTIQEWVDEIKLQIEHLGPDHTLLDIAKEGEFVNTVAEVLSLFYTQDSEDIKKACVG